MEAKKVRVVVVDTMEAANWPPEEATAFVAWFAEKIGQIPPEFVEAATIEITSDEDYDWHRPHIVICYRRPETEDETRQRQSESDAEDCRRAQAERALFEKLKSKYSAP